jgi:urea transport system substrate-binding protein
MGKGRRLLGVLGVVSLVGLSLAQGEVKVGVLHSLTGTMAISEVTVKNATLLAIEEINARGGVLGRKLIPVVEDGASDWTYAVLKIPDKMGLR